jgi:hypothetical protein
LNCIICFNCSLYFVQYKIAWTAIGRTCGLVAQGKLQLPAILYFFCLMFLVPAGSPFPPPTEKATNLETIPRLPAPSLLPSASEAVKVLKEDDQTPLIKSPR